MSNLLHTRQRISELLGIFAWQAKAYTASGNTDFNKVSEDVLVPLFRLIFTLPDLKNLNTQTKKNFPGIDLADDTAGIAFQVTATSDSQKIKDSLRTFVEKGFYNKYHRVIFYIITEKKESYPEKAFADIVQGNFEFDIGTDIIDFRDLVKLCNRFQIDKASKIYRILEANFGRGDYSVFSDKQTEPFEEVYLNLVDISFPSKLYTADLLIDRSEIVQNARGALKMKDPTRAIIRHYILEQLKLDFFSGWHLYKNQLITFHNLHDEDTFLSKIVDEGSIESIDTESFFVVNGNVDEQAYQLLKRALFEYRVALNNVPGRLVLHKSSNFNAAELSGFKAATTEMQVQSVDFLTVMDSDSRLFRKGLYPPYRGSHIELDKKTHLLYTRGSVKYYRTQTSLYIPQPLEIRIVESDESASTLCTEILGLTKMNWNNTQFDGKYPITIGCSRRVGEVMKYLTEKDPEPQISYSFYM
jgi:hypothetical protein